MSRKTKQFTLVSTESPLNVFRQVTYVQPAWPQRDRLLERCAHETVLGAARGGRPAAMTARPQTANFKSEPPFSATNPSSPNLPPERARAPSRQTSHPRPPAHRLRPVGLVAQPAQHPPVPLSPPPALPRGGGGPAAAGSSKTRCRRLIAGRRRRDGGEAGAGRRRRWWGGGCRLMVVLVMIM